MVLMAGTKTPVYLDAIVDEVKTKGHSLFSADKPEIAILAEIGKHLGKTFGKPAALKFWEVKFDPNGKKSKYVSPAGDTEVFQLHTDQSYEPIPARFLLIQCVKADAETFGINQLVHHADAIKSLAPETISQLQKPAFRTTPWKGPISNPSVSVLEANGTANGSIRYRNDREVSIAGTTKEATEALTKFQEALNDPAIKKDVPLKSGDILIIDNWKMLHGRSPLSGTSKRELLNLWVG